MKTLYIECNMGAAGDMLMGALCELHPDSDGFIDRLNALGIPGVSVTKKISSKCGINGTHIDVSVNGEHGDEHLHKHEHHHEYHRHHHSSMHDIEHIIGNFDLPSKVKSDILSVYRLIAEAESAAHSRPVDEIHFHEVGAMDAIADVTGVCMLINELAPEQIIVSPICTGSGHVHCAHGILPVPAPAAAYILTDIPIYSGSIKSELCTPTGAALLKHFADKFGEMPVMRINKTGYGMGIKDFDAANCVRAMLGEADADKHDCIIELACNIDDMTGEELGFASAQILAAGAVDVTSIPVYMKKNRPGIILSCLCRPGDKDRILSSIFQNTSTIGVREYECRRYVLNRSEHSISTDYGEVRVKYSDGFGAHRAKTEYDDVAALAKENGLSLRDVRSIIDKKRIK